MTVILSLFAESVRQSSKAAHPHAHCEILPFNVTGGNVLRVGIAGDGSSAASDTGCRAVAALCEVGRHAVYLDEHGVINVSPKRIFDGIHVNPVTVCSELKAV